MVDVVLATPPFWLAKVRVLSDGTGGSSTAPCERTFGRGSRRMSPMTDSPSSDAREVLLCLSVPVVEPLDAADDAHSPQVHLVGTRVVADVVRVACAVHQHCEARPAGAEGVRDASPGRTCDRVAGPDGVPLGRLRPVGVELELAFALQHD